MKTYSLYLDEQVVESFDDKVFEKKVDGAIDRDASRSEVLGRLMEAFVNDEMYVGADGSITSHNGGGNESD